MPAERCDTCRYLDQNGGLKMAVCRRFPPSLQGVFAPIQRTFHDWCGEHRPRDPAAPETA